jgi:5-methylcytosine-specific restriction endonuclease McrA
VCGDTRKPRRICNRGRVGCSWLAEADGAVGRNGSPQRRLWAAGQLQAMHNMAAQNIDGWEDIQGKKYPGYGRCIYCGSDGGADGLRDEHIIPYSLGGHTEITEASCRDCERRINPIDTHMAHAVFGEYRIHAGVQTRNPKDRPNSLPARFIVGEKEISLHLPMKDHPFSLALPVWGNAGFFRSVSIDSPFPEPFMHIYHYAPHTMHQTLGVAETEDFRIWSSGRLDPTLFARGIAKIAYCHTVVKYGLDGFRPLVLPDIILGRFSGVSYFVGSPLTMPSRPFPKGHRHMVRGVDVDGLPDHEKIIGMSLKLHLVYVRLFADSAHQQHGMPTYHVIAGARSCPKIVPQRPISETPRVIYL